MNFVEQNFNRDILTEKNIKKILNSDDIIGKYIKYGLDTHYPDIDLDTVDNDLLLDIAHSIVSDGNNKIKQADKYVDGLGKKKINVENFMEPNNEKYDDMDEEIINENYLTANDVIPEMSISGGSIILNGRVGKVLTGLLIDTGAENCIVFKSIVEKWGREYVALIDRKTTKLCQGVNGLSKTFGKIWFVEIEIDTGNDKWISVPITLDVIDDSEMIATRKTIKDKDKHITDFLNYHCYGKKVEENNSESNGNVDLILGMTFLKSYKANIDFHSNSLTLNGGLKIKFK
mgnify:CR=1 FL=1